MYKVMLVDDDVPMLRYLENLIDWEGLGVKIVASTFSSVKALTLFEEYHPDIVITDIGIPQIDGLELAFRLKEMDPATRIILLTCHEDFYYAKRAIQIAVDDYLIKDELEAGQLKVSILKSIDYLKESIDFQEARSYQATIHNNKDLLKQSFLKALTDEESNEKILQFSQSLGINWKHPDFIVCTSSMDNTPCSRDKLENQASEWHHQLFAIAEDLAKNKPEYTVLQDSDLNLVIIYNFKKSFITNVFEPLQQYLTSIHNEAKKSLQVEVHFFYHTRCDKASLGSRIKALNQLKFSSFYLDKLPIFQEVQSKRPSFHFVEDSLLAPFLKGLREGVQNVNQEEVQKVLVDLEKTARTLLLEPNQLKDKCLNILGQVVHANSSFIHFDLAVRNSTTIKQMIALFQLRILICLEELENAKQQHHLRSPKLKEIDQYIIEHMSENMTSIIMANHLHLNPSYFSRYFKQLTGENFTDYVHRYKMRIAVNMLLERDETIEVITSSLGYSDRTYFSKIFKKYTGKSPGEYKRTSQEKQLLKFGDV
ncbi:response regulator transcription factor [Neobacillus dielmonensis]|uniref:response regulator transcription factor n=1 Tax=Neobacillus dielmonensis TaxID=1347369 RepID=UPI0005A80D9F|nr:response regulator [Neobacillus dielmonensis]